MAKGVSAPMQVAAADSDSASLGVLLAILATPPETSGERTLKRLELARQLLGFSEVRIVNVLDVATFRTNGMSTAGKALEPWLRSRPAISAGLAECHGVVLGYGVSEPTGIARGHYRDQIDWLWRELRASDLPTWSVELPPRHPSRWHRLTYKLDPDILFPDALRAVLLQIDVSARAT